MERKAGGDGEKETVKEKDYQTTRERKREGRTDEASGKKPPIELVPPLRSLGVKF